MSNDRVPEIENDHLDLDRLDPHSNYNFFSPEVWQNGNIVLSLQQKIKSL